MSFENTRIYKLLSNLDAVTLNRFAKFIHSPYFNVNEKITNLFDILHNALKKGIAVQSKEELWNKVGFAVDYKDIKFRKLCNDLVERFEKFLISEQLDKNELLKTNLLIEAIKDENIEELLDKHLSKSVNIFDREIDRSSSFFLQKYLYDKKLMNLKTDYERKENIEKYTSKETYSKLSLNLSSFYIIERLRYNIDIITLNRQYKTEISTDIHQILPLINDDILEQNISIKIYITIYEMLTNLSDKSLFYKLKDIAVEHLFSFPQVEQAEIFDALFSYCVMWVNKGDIEFHSEYLDIHDWGIKEEYILIDGKLSPTSFRNYVFTGLRLKEFERVEKYINNNIVLLDEPKQSNALHLSLARLEFYRQNFDEVISQLNLVNYDDIWYNLNARTLLLAAYYELDEVDPLYYQMDAFSSFLRREKSLNQRKHRYLNFISYLKRIVNSYGNKSKIQKIKEKLTEDNQVVNKPWLLEKIDEQLN